METLRMKSEDQIFKRASEIRNNWNDTKKLKVLLDEWDKEFGHNYDNVVERVLGKFIEETWKKKAEEHGSSSLHDLLSILLDWPDAEFTKEEVEGGYKVTTTHCPVAANYGEIGRGDYGDKFHCISDLYICKGFNSRIRHRKISSQMQGDDSCVHFYTIGESST